MGFETNGYVIDDNLFDLTNFKCVSEMDKIKFQGSALSGIKMFPSIWLKKCEGLDHCKSQEEIDAFAS